MSKEIRLSKSKFTAGLQCLKRLYWLVREPQLVPEADAGKVALLDQGHEVGEAAQRAFPGGVTVQCEHWDVGNALRQTVNLMNDPAVPAIYEAAMVHDGVLVRVDVLQRRPHNRWRLIEVKSSSRLKEEHLPDVAIQKYVAEGAGLGIDRAELMHLNREYVYDGRELSYGRMFVRENVTDEAADFQTGIPALLRRQRRVLQGDKAPEVEPGDQCTTPYECEFFGLCNKEPPADHVSFIPALRQPRVEQLLEMGIASMKRVPADFPLNPVQRRACDCVRSGKPFFSEHIADGLAKLRYPLFYMDFETFNPAVPRYAGMRPFDNIPFQWSVHTQAKPGGRLEHHEFLGDDGGDPREAFLTSLLDVLETHEGGHIVCYSGYESTQLRSLAGWFPRHARRVEKVRSRLWDLLKFVRAHVYHPDFSGSFSIKQVLPALVPEMSYDGMAVADGSEAGQAYNTLVKGDLGVHERRDLRKALLKYCAQDSLAMARLMERLRRE